MERFLSDEEIAEQYSDILEKATIISVEFKASQDSGWLQISLPQNEQKNDEISNRKDYTDDDLLSEEKSDSFIIYSHSGEIAFDSWYPEKVYLHLVKTIIDKFRDKPDTEAHKMALKKYSDL